MPERIRMEKVEPFINEAFSLSCILARNIVLVRYKNYQRLPFLRKRKLANPEEFREIVFKEFENGIRSLKLDVREELEVIAKNVVYEIRKGGRPKLQKMIDSSYSQLLKEAKEK